MKHDRTITSHSKTISCQPESAEDFYNLGVTSQEKGESEAALQAYRQAIALNPQYAEAYNNMGTLLERQGQIEAAIQAYQTAVDLQPEYATAHYNLGSILQGKGENEAAIQAYQTTVDLDSQHAEAYYNLGTILHGQGRSEAALEAYQKAFALKPDYHFARWGMATAQLTVIHDSSEEIQLRRDNYRRELQDLARYYQSATDEEKAKSAIAVGWQQPFYLAYQGMCDRDLQQLYGSTIHSLMACRYPQWTQPRKIPSVSKERKIRVGFVSGFFHRHSVWKIPLQGWVENLDRGEFELFGYYTGSRRDAETVRAAKAFDRFECDCYELEQWAEKIVSDDLDILIYAEFGMNCLTLQLGCLRLAPVQAVFGGHPETSGLPTIDYHLSSDLMEPANGEEHYTEQLVRLPNLAVYYRLIPIEPELITRKELDIEEDEIMFWCCQSLFKYLPQHDDVFPRIARELTNAKFVFIELQSKFATNIFRQRLADAFARFELDYRDYCRFLPRLKGKAFNGTAAIADVFLDNIGWSGNNTIMESTVYNLPIVTLPGELMRGRHALGILKMMNLTETIAENKEQYIEIAVRLGRDVDYRERIVRQIALNKHKLYEDLQPIKALEEFIFKAVNKPRKFDNAKISETYQLAVRHHRANRLAKALQEYLNVLTLEPQHVEALYQLGIIAQQLKQLDEAENYFQAAIAVRGEFLLGWFSLGNLYQSRGQLPAAEKAYRQALELSPDSAPICNNLGYVLQQQNKWSEAISYYKQALDLMPNCLEADVNWGNALFARGKLSSEKQIHYAKLNYKLGLGRYQARDWETASIYYRQAILMQPDMLDAHYHLGSALQQQRKLSEAIACYQQVVRLDSNHQAVYYSLGQIYQDLGDLNRAISNFQQELTLINSEYARVDRVETNTATFAENFLVPQIPQGEVTVGDYKFPTIPKVTETEAKRPFWSVVIPVVNRPEYFPECLASVLAQWTGVEDMEIIILDNGSNPPQWKIPDSLGRGIVSYYRFPQTVSLQENWNTAISLCRGRWIHLLHHDDYVLPEFYARLKKSLENCPESVGAACTGYENINEDRQVVFSQQHGLNNYRGIIRNWILRIGVCCPLSPPSVVIKRSAYERLGGYKLDLPYTCDWEFYKRVASFYDWWYEPGILAHYREQANSITVAENMNGSSGIAHRRAIEISQSYLPTEHLTEITANSLSYHFDWCLNRADMPLRVGNLEAVICLIKEALTMDSSPPAIARLSRWMQQETAVALVTRLASSAKPRTEQERILLELAKNCLRDRHQSRSLKLTT